MKSKKNYVPVKLISKQFASALPFIFTNKNCELFDPFPCNFKEIENVYNLNGHRFYWFFMPWKNNQEFKVIMSR